MKNFTKQNFKTNPLWIRLLIMTFMLLAGVIEIYGTTVYFVNKPKWSQVNVHNWNGGTGTSWPGTEATKESYQVEGCDVYKCDIGNNKNFIFSNNGSNQTSDLHIDNGTWYYDGKQYSSKEAIEGAINNSHNTHTSITKFSVSSSDVIYFDATGTGWTTCYMYIGHNNYSKRFAMTRVAETKNLWKGTSFGSWSDAQAWYFSSEDWNDMANGKKECILCKACHHTENTFLMPYKSNFTNNAIYKASVNNQMYATSECYKNAWSWSSTVNTYSSSLSVSITNKVGTNNTANAGTVTVKKWNSTTSNAGSAYSTSFLSTSTATGSGTTGYLTAVRITLTASTGYELEKLTVGGTDVTSTYKTNGYYDKEITAATAIVATWKKSCNTVAKPTITLVSSPVKCGVDVTAGLITIDGYDAGTYTYVLNKDGNPTNIAYKSGYAITEAGSYTVTADVSENSCGAQTSEPQKVTVTDNTPTIDKFAVTAASDKVCKESSVTLTATHVNGATYAWYKGDSTTPISGATAYTYSPTITENTTFKVVVTKTNNGCPATAEATSTIQVIELPAAPTLSSNTDEVCSGKEFTLPGDYNWYEVSTGGTKLNSATISGGITSNKSYWAEAKNASGCVSSTRTEYTLTVNDKPAVPTLSADNTSLIYGDKAVFTVGNTVSGLTYTLYNGETAGESQKSTGGNLTFKVGEAGNYTVRVSNSCGTSTSDVVTITVCTPQTNEFRHANSSYNQLQAQPTYYPGDKAYFVSINNCCLTGTWSANLQRGEEAWYTGLTGGTPRFYMTLTRAGNFTITNMATNGCTQDKNVLVNLDFTITALSEVTNANGTASGADIALTWEQSANHTKVMVVRYPTAGTETIPAGGQSYSAGNTLGEGTVVYVGTSESYTDKNLPSGESYKYYFYTVNNNYYSEGVVLNMSSCPIPAKPNLSSTAITACNGECTAQGYITITNMNDYKDDTYTFELGNSVVTPDANGRLGINSTAYTQYTVTVTNSCGNPNSATVDIAINDNAPVITGNTSFKHNGSTTLTSDKGANTTWVALDGGDLNTRTGASVVFTAKENGTYHVQATYNGCSTTYTIKVQDDLYVWVRRPIKKETAYDQFYHKDQNSDASKGGDLFYKEFASLPGDYQQYNQGGKAADDKCTDKDGYTWYGFVVSKTAIENDYYFTVHAPNDKGYGGYHTHTYATQLVDMDADLYFVMDETPSNVNRGWNINAPVVVRASGDAMFNGNNFADFVPLYVKDANICGKEVVSFEWQKSTTQNGEYTTYNGKSGKGVNNIRTREAGWYRCVVTYGDGKGTATSNSIQVTNTTSGTPGTLADFSSKLPVIMVNTNGVGFPDECTVTGGKYPSAVADKMKEKISVDVIIKKGDQVLYDKKARMNYRGSSSLNFKKKSYAFVSGQDSCVFDKSRHDYVKTKKAKMLNILGLDYEANDKDWVMYAATADPSMIRNRLVFDLYQQMRPGEWGVHSTYVELIVDGEYQGVYVFMDKITANEGRVNITNSDGFIVKYDKTDVADRVERDGDQKTFATTRTGTKNSSQGIDSYDTKIDQRFEIEYPEKEDIEDAGGNWEAFYSKVQQRFEDFETALEKKDYTTVRSIIDYDSWADWFILTEFIKNEDGFRASNIFIYNGGKIMATPLWDQELSLDNRTRKAHGCESPDGLLSTTSSVYGDAFPAPFWFTNKKTDVNNLTGGLLNDPCFVTLVKTKWAEYQAGVLSASNCSTLVAKYYGELDDNIRSREVTKWPYTQDARGTTNSGKYMGYYNDKEGDPTHYSYNASKNAITSYASKRSTTLDSNSGLGKAINGLKGEALIFTISPSTVETTPWQQVILTVNAPEGYEYTVSYDDLTAAGAIIKEGNNTYGIKIPRPDGWGTAGNGDSDDSEEYEFTANIEVSGENACGTMQDGTATSTITLKDVTEVCDPEIKP